MPVAEQETLLKPLLKESQVMNEPTLIDKAQVFIDSTHGRERRTVLVLRFPTGDVHVDISIGQASRVRKLNRMATEKEQQ